MKSLTRYERAASWLPTWVIKPCRRVIDTWTTMTAPYDDDRFDPDGGAPYELRVLRYSGRIGLGLAAVAAVFLVAEFASIGLAEWWQPRAAVHLFSGGIAIAGGTALYLVSRVQRRRFGIAAAVLLLAWLGLAATPIWDFGWKVTVSITVPSLLALLSYWKELDP